MTATGTVDAALDVSRMTEPERFGANMRLKRAERDISQESLASLMGVHRTEVLKLENGVHDPKLTTIAKVCRALDVTPDRLFDGIVEHRHDTCDHREAEAADRPQESAQSSSRRTECERFGTNLRAARVRRGLSQDALSKLADVSRTQPSMLERGQRDPVMTTIAKFCRALEVAPDQLFRGIVRCQAERKADVPVGARAPESSVPSREAKRMTEETSLVARSEWCPDVEAVYVAFEELRRASTYGEEAAAFLNLEQAMESMASFLPGGSRHTLVVEHGADSWVEAGVAAHQAFEQFRDAPALDTRWDAFNRLADAAADLASHLPNWDTEAGVLIVAS